MQINYFPTNGCNPYSGYGKVEIGVARGLQDAGVRLNLAPKAVVPTLVVGYADWLKAPHICHTRKWLLTMNESTKISDKWVELINAHAERVLVCSPHGVDVFRESGVRVPVHYVGLGVDAVGETDDVHPGWDGESPFTYLSYTYGDMRKGAELVGFAFNRMQKEIPNIRLKIKVRDGFESTWIGAMGEIPGVEIVDGIQGADAWAALMRECHCFCFPSRGEGFGLPPRETTLAGMPTIATRWSGLGDVEAWGLPVDIKGLVIARFSTADANHEKAMWADPDDKHLEHQMRWVLRHYDEARLLAMRGRAYLQTNFNWSVIAGRIVSLLIENR